MDLKQIREYIRDSVFESILHGTLKSDVTDKSMLQLVIKT